ncbi:MAG TPA: dihydrodipicolinate synthase family protein [Bryobacteraceae bacterium]|nr:dihydrodipicolinate synthase family protein [Bryobacteraceae bacterium]
MRGIVPAVVTPFRDDELVDYKAWQQQIDLLISSGVDGLFILGGQGEFFALSDEEREVAARFCVQQAAGRVPVYANVGCLTTRDTVRLAQKAQADGVQYLVVITPFYIRPSEDELAAHYAEIASSVLIPVLAYDIPERTGVGLSPKILKRVAAKCENFVGLKDSSGDLDRIGEYTAAGLSVFMGRDLLILEGLKRGCVGAMSACSNVAPRAFVELYRAFQSGDVVAAARLQALIDPLRRTFELGTFPAIVKEAMNLAGLSVGRCRRPVGPMPESALPQIEAALAPLRDAGYLPPPVAMRARRA